MGSMAPMPKRLPDELFRSSSASESADVQGPSGPELQSSRRVRSVIRSREVREFPLPMVVAAILGALLIGFVVGKLVSFQSGDAGVLEPVVSATSAEPSVMPSPASTLVPWEGPVRAIPVVEASGTCLTDLDAPGNEPSNLVDGDPDSLWRCSGAGVGEVITFSLEGGEELVGVRLVNGNTSSLDRYTAERRLLRVKWEFGDGSWVVQPLAANDRNPQEFRFPPISSAGTITMTILDATVPGDISGDTSGSNDAVSIGFLQFLGVDS